MLSYSDIGSNSGLLETPRSLSEHILIQRIVIVFMTKVQIVHKMVMVYLIFIFVSLNVFAFVRPFYLLTNPLWCQFSTENRHCGRCFFAKKKTNKELSPRFGG